MCKQERRSFPWSMLICAMGFALLCLPAYQQLREIKQDERIYANIATGVRSTQKPIQTAENETGTSDSEGLIEHESSPQSTINIKETEGSPVQVPIHASPGTPTMLPTLMPVPSTLPGASQAIHHSPARPMRSTSPTVNASALITQNPDYIAWLTIPGTPVDYPVVQSDDSEYYLNHLLTGERSKLGCLFSLTSADYALPSKNIAIYGHHLSNSDAMFSSLMEYKNKRYWEQYPTVILDSIYGKRTYRIFAVLNMHIFNWDPSTANFINNDTFLRFVRHAQKKVMYETDVVVREDDHILTLITCDRSYGGVSGRLLVMAVEQK